MNTRIYHLIVKTKNGAIVYLTKYPMNHAQCMVNKSKFSNPARIELLEVSE